MHAVVLVLVEVLIVIGLSRLVGLGCRWIKQPLVIGEIIAGIMLGPSVRISCPWFSSGSVPSRQFPS